MTKQERKEKLERMKPHCYTCRLFHQMVDGTLQDISFCSKIYPTCPCKKCIVTMVCCDVCIPYQKSIKKMYVEEDKLRPIQ